MRFHILLYTLQSSCSKSSLDTTVECNSEKKTESDSDRGRRCSPGGKVSGSALCGGKVLSGRGQASHSGDEGNFRKEQKKIEFSWSNEKSKIPESTWPKATSQS